MEVDTHTYNPYLQKETIRQLREEMVDGLDLQNYSIDQYKKWIQDQYAKITDSNHSSLNNSVFRILLQYFKGKTKAEKEKFLILVDCVLEYAHLISDRLLLLSSLLDELIDKQLCDSLIDPLIHVEKLQKINNVDTEDISTYSIGGCHFFCTKTSHIMHSAYSAVFPKGRSLFLHSAPSSICTYTPRKHFTSNNSINPWNPAPALSKW